MTILRHCTRFQNVLDQGKCKQEPMSPKAFLKCFEMEIFFFFCIQEITPQCFTCWYCFAFYPRPVLGFGYCRCLRLCVCVCLSVCLCVCAITWDPFKLGSPNLDQRCKTPWLTHWGRHHMARQCQASLPWHRHVATPACCTYLASAATWQQKQQSYTPGRNLKHCTFLFVDIAEIGTVSVLSSNQNEAYISCRLKPETLTWPDLTDLA